MTVHVSKYIIDTNGSETLPSQFINVVPDTQGVSGFINDRQTKKNVFSKRLGTKSPSDCLYFLYKLQSHPIGLFTNKGGRYIVTVSKEGRLRF